MLLRDHALEELVLVCVFLFIEPLRVLLVLIVQLGLGLTIPGLRLLAGLSELGGHFFVSVEH
jgi:hypothetical protein